MQFYIGSTGCLYWCPTSAKTLNGAKSLASKNFLSYPGGVLVVAVKLNDRYETLAVKYGYDKKWQNT